MSCMTLCRWSVYLEHILGRGGGGGVSSKLLYPFLELSHPPWLVPVLQVACKASRSCGYIRLRFQVLSGNTNEGSAVIANFTDTTYIDSNLVAFTTYFYTIEAVNRAGQCCPVHSNVGGPSFRYPSPQLVAITRRAYVYCLPPFSVFTWNSCLCGFVQKIHG